MLSNYRLASLVAAPTITYTMALVTVLLRCWVKKKILKTFLWDDWLMLIALAIFTALTAVDYNQITQGLGQHTADLPLDKITACLHLWFVGQITYLILTIFIKMSISIFLLRLALERVHRIIIYATLIFYIAACVAFIIDVVLQCAPVAFAWDKTILGGTCQSTAAQSAAGLVNAATTTSTDLLYTLLPIWLIRNIQMDTKTKISVGLILSMGLISTSATAVRFKYIIELGKSNDFLYDVYGLQIWSTIEPGLGITAASAATLRPLLRIFVAKAGFGSTQRSLQKESGSDYNTPTVGLRGHVRTDSHEMELGAEIHPTGSVTKLIQDVPSAVSEVDPAPRIR